MIAVPSRPADAPSPASASNPKRGSWADMYIARKLRNVLRGLIQCHATTNLKRGLWNEEYARGRWAGLESMPGDCLYGHVEEHARNGDVLDLGCGPGTTGSELATAAYRSYTGVDISDVAIAKARARTDGTRRAGQNRYVQSDIVTYEPDRRYDVIVFGDSLYYVAYHRIPEMLSRYANHLTKDGVYIARLNGYEKIADLIERSFDVLEKHRYHDSRISVIVFRPRAARPLRAKATDLPRPCCA